MSDIEAAFSCYLCNSTNLVSLRVPRLWIGESYAFSGLLGKLGLSKCKTCGLIFTNPRPATKRLDRFYSGDSYVCHTIAGSASGSRKASYLIDLIEQSYTGPRTLLDFGCGSGAFMSVAQQSGWKVRGLEPGQRGRESCVNLGLNVAATLNALKGERFGVITLHHVLEHVPDPIKILRDLRPLLTPHGILFVEVPNARSLRAVCATNLIRSLSPKVDERYRAFPIHLMYHRRKTLALAVQRAGYKELYSSTVGIGLDEFFVESAKNHSGGSKAAPLRKARSPILSFVKNVFLQLGFGENLLIMATPQHE
jgi:SAM-dependent methyltransferase